MFAQVIIDKINEYSLSDTLYVEGHTNLYFHKRIWTRVCSAYTLTGEEFGWEQRRIESPTQLIANVELENMTHPLKA